MNNKMIERIDIELARLQSIIDCTRAVLPDEKFVEIRSTMDILRGCKAALAQQQEADPVFAVQASDIEVLKDYKGQCTILARKADQAPAAWVRVFLHPPAAQPQVPDAMTYLDAPLGSGTMADHYADGWNDCREGGRDMTNVDKIRDALIVGINLAKSAGWTRHQQDEIAEAEEALRLFDEMMDKGSVAAPKLPQDVEEFIAENAYIHTTKVETIGPETIRAWMSGHVRVPVALIENTLAAVREELNKAHNEAYPVCCGQAGQECCGSPDPEWPPHAMATMDVLGPIEKELSSMLNASKGE